MGIDYLIFNNVDSRDYDIEVFFKDIDRTPKRVYEIVEVPGRNGAIYVDQKRYEDVSVAYDCIALDDADRKAFVNALASQIGRKRLQDSFNDDEFYHAVFNGDVEPSVTSDREQSTFSVYFTRSPQRYLVSGETPITVEDGDAIVNPTLFDAQPLLAIKGYGSVQIGNHNIELQNVAMGSIKLLASKRVVGTSGKWTFPSVVVNSGDPEYVEKVEANAVFQSSKMLKSAEVTSVSGYVNASAEVSVSDLNGYLTVAMNDIEYATADSSKNCSVTVTFTAQDDTTASVTFNFYAIYDRLPTSAYDTFEIKATQSAIGFVNAALNSNITLTSSELTAVSTASALGNPSYIDCEIGEAYKRLGGRIFSLNSYVDLGSDLPKLSSGSNSIAYDNTITEVSITPRWWKI